ncbi:hypothetical protein DS901_16795 [Loktanella sp. D2R18]|nr:hypothetical protein DS901_16795 [Loktanella sp. D2R18]
MHPYACVHTAGRSTCRYIDRWLWFGGHHDR